MSDGDQLEVFEIAQKMAIGVSAKTPNLYEDVASACCEKGLLLLKGGATLKDNKPEILRDMVNAGRRFIYNENNHSHDDLSDFETFFADSSTSNDQHKTLELQQTIKAMLDELNDEQTEIFFYYYGLGMDQKQVAEIMDTSQQTISRRISVINVTLKRFGQENELFFEKIFEV